MTLLGALDQGTTSTRFMVIDDRGKVVGMAAQEHRQIFPRPGWVEHDPVEIWEATQQVIGAGLAAAGIAASDLAAVGIANQRETTVAWDRASGTPVANAIVWQDTRTDALCRTLAEDPGGRWFRQLTGLPPATYFAGPKMRWLLDSDSSLRTRAEAGEIAFGTMDSWLLWNLTGRHATDVTNASRTMLMSLETLDWDAAAVERLGVPAVALPEIVPSVGEIASAGGVLDGVTVAGMLGDQQAALFGQACFSPGQAKSTYGTGCFLLLNTGTEPVPSSHGLLTTVGYRLGDDPPAYALEGSVAVAGAGVQWLRDNLGIVDDAADTERLAATVADTGDVYFVPAFSGLFAPHWRSDARGVVVGLTGHTTAAHLVRAVLEATAFQTAEVLAAMEADSGVTVESLSVDGGMTTNELLMQFQADLLGVPVVLPTVAETTALGAAYAAGVAVGVFGGLGELAGLWEERRRWEPSMEPATRSRLRHRWSQAVERTLDWVD